MEKGCKTQEERRRDVREFGKRGKMLEWAGNSGENTERGSQLTDSRKKTVTADRQQADTRQTADHQETNSNNMADR
jgi:hypothetical protein